MFVNYKDFLEVESNDQSCLTVAKDAEKLLIPGSPVPTVIP